MTSFKVPSKNAEYEFTEKRSRFLSRIFRIETAEEAAEILRATQKKYWDASHNVYAYVLENGMERFSDDGEPQGTSGMPTLAVLRGAGVRNALCVTTRWFGGILLGTGGLTRAYAQGAKGALENAGISVMAPFYTLSLDCDYTYLDPLRRLFPRIGVRETDCVYGEKASLSLICEPESFENVRRQITELSSGKLCVNFLGEKIFEKKAE